jgi:hypothetical protein
MQEGGGVNKLNDCGQGDMICAFIAAQPSGEDKKRGAKTLAAAINQILGHLGETRHLGGKTDLKRLLHLLHIIFDQIDELLHEILSLLAFIQNPFLLVKGFLDLL